MDLGSNNISPRDYAGKKVRCVILGSLSSETRTAKQSGKNFDVYSLKLRNWSTSEKIEIQNLMRSQLNHLVSAYGSDPEKWDQKQIILDADQAGQYFNWSLTPYVHDVVTEEKVQ